LGIGEVIDRDSKKNIQQNISNWQTENRCQRKWNILMDVKLSHGHFWQFVRWRMEASLK
jgi:hypothetical protein